MRGRHAITIERAPLVEDRFGNETRDWANATQRTISGCSVQPLAGTEAVVNRDTAVSRWQVFAPLGTDLLASDRVLYNDVRYEVDGEVQSWDFPRGYVYALLQKVT